MTKDKRKGKKNRIFQLQVASSSSLPFKKTQKILRFRINFSIIICIHEGCITQSRSAQFSRDRKSGSNSNPRGEILLTHPSPHHVTKNKKKRKKIFLFVLFLSSTYLQSGLLGVPRPTSSAAYSTLQ